MRLFGLILFIGILFIHSITLAQWTKTNGPEGGVINVIFNDVTSGYIYAGGNGLYRSSDNGATWSEATTGMAGTDGPVDMVRVGSNLFAASYDKIYLSTNNGDNWTSKSSGLVGQPLSISAIGNTIVVGTSIFGVYYSTNNGDNWTAASGFPPFNNIVQTIIAFGTKLIAGLGGKGIWTSSDSGKTWSSSYTGTVFGASHSVNSLAIHGSKIFAANSDSGVFVSNDGGTSWSHSSSGMNPRAMVSKVASNGTTLYAHVIGAHTGIDTGIVYRSTDNGASWVSVKSDLFSIYGYCLGFGTGKVFFATWAGIYASTNNGANWLPSNTGLDNANVLSMTVSGSTLFAGYAGGIARTVDGGVTWTAVNNGVPANTGITSLTAHDSYVFAATGAGVLRTGDNGASWSLVNNGLSGSALYVGVVAAGGTFVYAGGAFGGVYVSSDNGGSWTGPGTGLPGFGGINALYVDGTNLWAAVASNGVYRSTDNGATWSASSNGLPPFGRNVSAITRSGSTLFASLTSSSTGSVYISTDNGANWTSSSNGIPSNSYLVTLYSVGGSIFAGFNYTGTGVASGLYRTTDDGANWSTVNDGLPNPCSINSIAVMGGNMYGSYLGVWKHPLSDVTAVEERPGVLPKSFALEQNYPNPFNPETEIRFMLHVSGFTTLKVYDMLGREVATLIDRELYAGIFSTTWDASGLPSGVYCYRLQSGSFSQVRKMVLIK